MPFRHATGREQCNSCRRPLRAGEPIYAGELTPATWCEGCARDRLGEVLEGPVPQMAPLGMGRFDAKAAGAALRGKILKWREDNRQKQTGEQR